MILVYINIMLCEKLALNYTHIEKNIANYGNITEILHLLNSPEINV